MGGVLGAEYRLYHESDTVNDGGALGRKLAKMKQTLGWSYSEVERRSGINDSTVAQILTGRMAGSRATRAALRSAFEKGMAERNAAIRRLKSIKAKVDSQRGAA